VNASSRLNLTGERLLRLQRALGRLPGAPAGPDRFAALFADPAVMMSDLIERVLRGGQAAPADDRAEADVGRKPLPAPGPLPTGTSSSVPATAPAGATRPGGHQAMPPWRRHLDATVPPWRRHLDSTVGKPGEHRALADPSLTWPSAGPVRSASPTQERVLAAPADSTPSATDQAVSLPPVQDTTGVARYRGKDAGAPTGSSPPADTGTRPTVTRAGRSRRPPGRLPAGGARTPGLAPPHGATAPGLWPAPERADAAAPEPPASARLAPGFPGLAAALQTNIAYPAASATEISVPRPETALSPARSAAAHDGAGAAAAGLGGPRVSREADPRDPDAEYASGLRWLMERLASELELELIRAYGTSGR